MEQEKPSYYSILTAEVRYDETLTPSAKLLFSEITALTNKSGICWASNAYFARLYGIHEHTVSRLITMLTKKGYIKVVYEDTQRVISLTETLREVNNLVNTPTQKRQRGVDKKVKQNNTSINTKVNTKKNIAQRAVGLYSLFWKDVYGTEYEATNWGRLGKTLKPLEKLNDWQLASLIWLHFNWYGASGDDSRTNKYLADKFFPLEWLTNNLNGYRTYLVNSLEVDWENEEAVKKFILPELTKVGWVH